MKDGPNELNLIFFVLILFQDIYSIVCKCVRFQEWGTKLASDEKTYKKGGNNDLRINLNKFPFVILYKRNQV